MNWGKIIISFTSILLFLSINFVPSTGTKISYSLDKSLLEAGDIIFRRGHSLVSEMVLFADKKSDYSHVGLLIKEGNEIFVVHAVPDEGEDGVDTIKMETVEEFLKPVRSSAAAVLRYTGNNVINIQNDVVQYAKAAHSNHLLFDGALDIKSDDKLYCTELIWKAYLKAGVDLIENRFDQLSIPLYNGDYIFPGSLLYSKYLKPITSIKYRETK